MDDKRLTLLVQRAVEQRCEPLKPDPFLASRVMRMAEDKGEMKVKRKLSVALVLCILLAILSATAIAAVVLSGMEIVEQEAVPMAQSNDRQARRVGVYSNEELQALIRSAAANGIILDDDSSVMAALHSGESYYESETIMEICREAFGGLFYEWTVEQQYWYQEMMIAIGYQTNNFYHLPPEGGLTSEEARELAISSLLNAYGSDLPLDDPSKYRKTESLEESGWIFTYNPRTLTDPWFIISFGPHGEDISHNATVTDWSNYTESRLAIGIHATFGYNTWQQEDWGLEGWYTFGQMLPAARRTSEWSAEYDGYLATTYLLPAAGDLPAAEAKSIAFADAETDYITDSFMLLLGDGERRIWKVTMVMPGNDGTEEKRSWEIDAATGDILHRMTFTDNDLPWAAYMLHSTYEAVRGDTTTAAKAKEISIALLRRELDDETIPFDDAAVYRIDVRRIGMAGFHAISGYDVFFYPKMLGYARCAVNVSPDGTAKIKYASAPGLTADNLHSRFDDVHGSSLTWDQSIWVEFDRMLDTLGEPATFEGRLFAATSYPDASAVRLSLDDALDAVQLDLGTRAEDPVSWVLIDAKPNPVWKIRMGTFPANTLYEVDAMTGEIVDRELYVYENDAFDHDMKMYTLRSTYMPAALAEFGPERVAMELTVKSDFSAFDTDETIFMDKNSYAVSVDGMIVTFTALRDDLPSYRTTILEGGLDAIVEYIPPAAPPTPAPEPGRVNG